MDLADLSHVAGAFVSLLLWPTLGVLGLLQKRAIPVLAVTWVLWMVVGAWAQLSGNDLGFGEKHFRQAWLVGLGVGAVLVSIAWLCNQPRVAGWIKVALGALTIAVFVQALYVFVTRLA